MKLHQLRAFIATLDAGSFSEAGHRLGISQASVSHSIEGLERDLNVKLLDRGRFGAKPTETGLEIAAYARGILKFTETIEQQAHLANGELRGTLRVTAFRSAASKILPRVMATLRKEHPALQLQLVELENEHKPGIARRAMVRDHRVDLALVSYAPPKEKNLIFWRLTQDVVKAIVLKTDTREQLTWEEVGRSPLILPIGDDVHDTYTRWHLKNLMGEIAPAYEVKEDTTIVRMVSEGLGVGLLPELAIDELPKNVKAIPTETPLERPIYTAILPTSLKVPAVRAFIKALKKRFPESELPTLS